MTKIVTATAVMQLAERGKLGLDTKVREYLPEFPGDAATVRHLLSHSSGLANPIPVRWGAPGGRRTPRRA
jgi:CubicO group peptidase (beta-lactamase class C family)